MVRSSISRFEKGDCIVPLLLVLTKLLWVLRLRGTATAVMNYSNKYLAIGQFMWSSH